jgi:phosphoribosylanthranilate isomerase
VIVQIYEVTTPEEARELCALGVDHIGILVGDGSFPRELPIGRAREIMAAIEPPSKASVLSLSPDVDFVKKIVGELRPPILHIGSQLDEIGAGALKTLKLSFPGMLIMRSIPVLSAESVVAAKSYEGVADLLLLDSYNPDSRQFGALGTTHSWVLDRAIIDSVSMQVIIAGGLGPENVADAIGATRPAGVDSKTRTDKADGSHAKDLAKVRAFLKAARES